MNDSEVALLRERTKSRWRGVRGPREFLGAFISIAGGMLVVGVLLFLLLAFIVRWITGFNLGLQTPYGTEIVWSMVLICLIGAAAAVLRSGRPRPELVTKLRSDIQAAKVLIEEHTLVEAKVFQEEEHGGLFYFLRTSDDLVYLSFDYESQDLGVGGEDPMSSSFKPRTTLRIEKTPHARQLLSEHFFGDALPVPKPLPMAVRADIWPKCGEFVDVAWSAIEAKYGGQGP